MVRGVVATAVASMLLPDCDGLVSGDCCHVALDSFQSVRSVVKTATSGPHDTTTVDTMSWVERITAQATADRQTGSQQLPEYVDMSETSRAFKTADFRWFHALTARGRQI